MERELTFPYNFIFTRTAFVRTRSWKSTRTRWGRLELATSAIISQATKPLY